MQLSVKAPLSISNLKTNIISHKSQHLNEADKKETNLWDLSTEGFSKDLAASLELTKDNFHNKENGHLYCSQDMKLQLDSLGEQNSKLLTEN